MECSNCDCHQVVINTHCSKAEDSSNFQLETLFDGVANEVGKTYDLLQPLSDYKGVLVKTMVDINAKWHDYIFIPSPADRLEERYAKVLHVYKDSRWQIAWCFSSVGTLLVTACQSGAPEADQSGSVTAIVGVYGLK